jgi:integrase
MTKALTVRAVESVKPAAKRREIPDGLLAGLYLVVQPSGAKSWAVRYRFKGIPRKHTLGSFPALDLVHARKAASKALRTAAEGQDPGVGKQELRAGAGKPGTVAAVVAEFVADHCARKNKPRTRAETERNFKLHVLPHWRGRSVQSIAKQDVRAILKRLVAAETPIAANRVFAATRKFFNWCVKEGYLETSPCAGLSSPSEERSRDRALSDSELPRVWIAATKVGGSFGALVRLLVLAGARRDEVAGMRWSEIDLDGCLWTLPPERTKNGLEHEVPLCDGAIEILEALPRFEGCDFVLSNDGKTAASNFGKNKKRLDALLPADMPAWRLHDLRRTVATGMAKLGVELPVIERCLNHVSGSFAGIVGVYQKHSFAREKRDAFQRWSAHVNHIVSGRSARVVKLTRRG